MSDDIQDKATLVARIRHSRALIDRIFAQAESVDMDEDVAGGWSLRDIMAHITLWETYALQRFEEASRGEQPHLLEDVSTAHIDALNAEGAAAGRKKALAQVEVEYPNIHQRLMRAINAIPEDRGDPWWSLWPDEATVWALASDNTWGHYEEHLPDLQRWLAAHDD